MKWCCGLNEPPLSLQSHCTVAIMWLSAAEATMEFPLDLQEDGKLMLVQLRSPSCIFSYYYIFFKPILEIKYKRSFECDKTSALSLRRLLSSLFISNGKKGHSMKLLVDG